MEQHGATEHNVNWTMVPQHDDCYKCSLNKLGVEFAIIRLSPMVF